jgi:hypothetical protein
VSSLEQPIASHSRPKRLTAALEQHRATESNPEWSKAAQRSLKLHRARQKAKVAETKAAQSGPKQPRVVQSNPEWSKAAETKNDKPELRVLTDYDDFFKDYVDALVEQKAKSGQAFKVANIVIDAGPWRSYDVKIKQTSDTLLLDFYSVCRFRGGPDADDEILRAL